MPRVHGVELSIAAVALASPRVRPTIVCDIMRPGLFEPEQFDVVCLFQVFDHIADPGALLDECWRVLKPGGPSCVSTTTQAVSARLLKQRSPIIDIEHTFLYSPATLARLFTDHGFTVCHVRPIRNRFTLRYLAHLAPLPSASADIVWRVDRLAIGGVPLWAPLGNMELVARKPEGFD